MGDEVLGDVDTEEADDEEVIRLGDRAEAAARAAARVAFETAIPTEARTPGVLPISTVDAAFVRAGAADRAVGGCRVVIGAAAEVRTDSRGQGEVSIAGLADGRHPVRVAAPASADGPPGPGFPTDGAGEIFAPLEGTVDIAGGAVTGARGTGVTLVDGVLQLALWPLWIRSANNSARTRPLDMIVVHHTGTTNLRSVMQTFLTGDTSAHYVVATDGRTVKLVADERTAFHAGFTHWQDRDGLNSSSIGIEIVHDTAAGPYPDAQVAAVVALIERLRQAFPAIAAERVVGHSDVAVSRQDDPPPRRHGRKSTDPGSAFPWERLEALGLGLVPLPGEPDRAMYAGIFAADPRAVLREGDAGEAVRELQRDLEAIGYLCPADGDFGKITHWALKMFQQHIFSGSRLLSNDGQWNSGTGTLEPATATMLKRVLGEVATS